MGQQNEFIRFILQPQLDDTTIEKCIRDILETFRKYKIRIYLRSKDPSNFGSFKHEIGEETIVEHIKMIEFLVVIGPHSIEEIKKIIEKDILNFNDHIKGFTIPPIVKRYCRDVRL